MADKSISQTPLWGGKIRYTLGRPNWENRRMPDIRRPGATVQIEERRLIDVIILGDGFTAESDFNDALGEWLDKFYAIKVYDTFAGCIRIRALYTPSNQPASANRASYYRVLTTEDGTAIVKSNEWWKADDTDGVVFRKAFWESVDTFADANPRRYSMDLDVGSVGWSILHKKTSQDITNEELRDLYRNLVVCLLVRTAVKEHPSGFAQPVSRPAPDQSRHVKVAFGASEIHEFSHALGYLKDEYINGKYDNGEYVNGRDADNADNEEPHVDPATPSVFSLSNLRYSDRVDSIPWIHLSPCGWQGRTASGQKPSPLLGWLWVGGRGDHLGVWHSEYHCLMNGNHDNFEFTQVTAEDPTANADGTYTDENGADLRDDDRFCLWCQEIMAIRILEKTDQLLEDGDPESVTSQGIVWYARWLERLRSNYYQIFDVAQQIVDAEARYARLKPGRNSEPLWQSDLYSVPKAAVAGSTPSVPPLSDDEVFLLTGFAAIP